MPGVIKHWLPCLVLCVLTHFALETALGEDVNRPRTGERFCFSLQDWDADRQSRPCAKIVRLFEDGSLRVRVTDADGTFRYGAGIGAEDR